MKLMNVAVYMEYRFCKRLRPTTECFLLQTKTYSERYTYCRTSSLYLSHILFHVLKRDFIVTVKRKIADIKASLGSA